MNKFILPMALISAATMGVMVLDDTTKDAYESSVSFAASGGIEKHKHKHLEVVGWRVKPSVNLSVTPDSMGPGWNIYIDTENFKFTPEHVNQQNIENEGHAHLFVDGQKVARVYSNWFYLYRLKPGTHSIGVSLNTNKHEELVLNSEPLLAKVNIVQK